MKTMARDNAKRCWREALVVGVFALCCLFMCFVPSPTILEAQFGQAVRARVLSVDNEGVALHGHVKFGTQRLKVEILRGAHKGKTLLAANELRAQLELDKEFEVGDKIIVVVPDGQLLPGQMLVAKDFDRSIWTYSLFALFCLMLCVFGGWVGAKALFSFFLSGVVMWKLVIPLVLRGYAASWVIFFCVCFLTAAIIFMVAGFTKKGTVAFLGSISGVLAGLGMAHGFARLMEINGAVLPYAQTVLFSGFPNLNLQDLFIGAMMLASSGAVMDLGMDIASGVEEVALHKPGLQPRTLMASGMRIGRSVVGTMTTTLLLAYSGGYITLLMMFSTQNTAMQDILNNPLVASEIVKTLIGSFSLVLVAPFTAFFAGLFFGERKHGKDSYD